MFESHITVNVDNIDNFIDKCRKIKVKPIIIDNDTGSGNLRQVMTAKFHITKNYYTAISEMDKIANSFRAEDVIRRKLENVDKYPPFWYKYREFHSKFRVGREQLDDFLSFVNRLGGHTAVNKLKEKDNEGNIYCFVNTRDQAKYRDIVVRAINKGYNHVNTINEYVVYDDNPMIDKVYYECMECPLKLKIGDNISVGS